MRKNQICTALLLTFFVITLSSCSWATKVYEDVCGEELAIVENVKDPLYTTMDVVAQRRDEIVKMEIDSVYYAIPEPILIAIIDKIGVDAYRSDVVANYFIDIVYYTGLLTGTKNVKHFVPDSIPSKPPVDKEHSVIPAGGV